MSATAIVIAQNLLLAARRGCARLEWQAPAREATTAAFYAGLGAERRDDWRPYRLTPGSGGCSPRRVHCTTDR
jgi:hypothetical protein